MSFALLSSNDPPQTPRPEAPAPAVARAEPAPAAQNRTLAGEWFFIPLPRTQEPGLYPPEYIELRVTENSGLLHGRYRARYHITDRAISPAVAFQFEGRADPDGASLPWSGLGGSRGTITLRLLASGALEVTWVADQIGEGQGLVSGTATLVRKLD